MENASKAIIIAGSMLIGVIVLTIISYIWVTFDSTSKDVQEKIDARVLTEFNNNFFKYQGSKECTIHDIVSLASFAKQNNQSIDKNSKKYINVYLMNVQGINSTTDLSTLEEEVYMNLLNKHSVESTLSKIQYYTCVQITTVDVDEGSRVKSITFRKN